MLVVAVAGTRTMGAALDVSQTATEAAAAMAITNIILFMLSSYRDQLYIPAPSDQYVDLNQL